MKIALTILFLSISCIAFPQDRIYPLDANANDILSGYNGTMGSGINAPTPATDRFNNDSAALYFNGNNNIDLPITGMTGAEFSVSAWISYPYTFLDFKTWFSVGNHSTTDQVAGMGQGVGGNGIAFFGYRIAPSGYGIGTNGQPSPNQWYHVICIYGSDYIMMYVNGILIDSVPNNMALPAYGTGPTALIGSRGPGLPGWVGSIDDLHYYDHALTTTQVDSLSNSEINRITGTCFIDLNGDSIKQSNEPYANNVTVNSGSASGFSFLNQTDSAGIFMVQTDTGAVQTQVTVPYYTVYPSVYNSNHNTFGNIDTINFALTPIPGITDAGIALIPGNAPVPGFQTRYNLVCYNNGTDTVGGTILFVKKPGLPFVTSFPLPDSVSGDSLYWNFNNLYPLQTTVIELRLYVDTVFNFGDTLYFDITLNVDSSLTDINPVDNHTIVKQVVFASHDPNDKCVLEGNTITTTQVSDGQYLTYVVRFQNTGTIAARDVFVLDTLSSLLDWSSFEMIYSDHAYNLSVKNGNQVRWDFPNINLPDSNTNAAASEGFVCYRLKPLSTLVPGDVIENTAYIYFDFNLPVVTNTASTEVISIFLGTEEVSISKNELPVYPNPVATNLKIDVTNPGGVMYIYNSLGIKVLELNIQNRITEIQVDDLRAGIYFISYSDGKKFLSGKFLKQ